MRAEIFNFPFSTFNSHMRILFVSGGSIGHLAPLVAVEKEAKKIDKKLQSHFLCSTKKEDAEYLRHEGVKFTQAPRPRKNLLLPVSYVRNRSVAKRVLKEFKPDVIFSKGGSISVPLCRAAKKRGIPVVIHESDSIMGKANAMIAPIATAICLGFPPSDEQRSFGVETIVTGNPVRGAVTKGNAKRARSLTHFAGKRPVLLVIGGSQGAQALNNAVVMHLEKLLQVCDIVHLTGPGKKGGKRRAGYFAREILYKELADIYAIADLALSRAGAGSISECIANTVPMVLVPIRGLANDHQEENAVRMKAAGAAVILEQTHLELDLPKVIVNLMNDAHGKRTAMTKATAILRHPEAARLIAKILFRCVAKRRRGH